MLKKESSLGSHAAVPKISCYKGLFSCNDHGDFFSCFFKYLGIFQIHSEDYICEDQIIDLNEDIVL